MGFTTLYSILHRHVSYPFPFLNNDHNDDIGGEFHEAIHVCQFIKLTLCLLHYYLFIVFLIYILFFPLPAILKRY